MEMPSSPLTSLCFGEKLADESVKKQALLPTRKAFCKARGALLASRNFPVLAQEDDEE